MRDALKAEHGDPAQLQRTRRELKGLEDALAKASERYLTETDDQPAQVHQKTFQALLARKTELEKVVQAATARAKEKPDVDKIIGKALGYMKRLDEALQRIEPAELHAVLWELIDHVDLYFEKRQAGSRTKCTFVRGVIFVRPGVLHPTYQPSGSSRRTSWR
jgi:hypothetical protein